jgi:hypothetical protein
MRPIAEVVHCADMRPASFGGSRLVAVASVIADAAAIHTPIFNGVSLTDDFIARKSDPCLSRSG